MKRFITLLAIIPLITFAQSKKTTAINPPLIESITSDTVNGIFIQVLFSYDENNRVIGIINKDVSIIKDSTKTDILVEKINLKETFEYQGNAKLPFVRISSFYDLDNKTKEWIVYSIKKTYFLYKNEQRVGDSSLSLRNDDNKRDFKWDDNKKAAIIVSKLEKTSSRIYQKNDFTNRSTNYPEIVINEFKLTPSSNISYYLYEYRYGGRGRSGEYFTFLKYDANLNPLKQLNIASTLSNEKVSFVLSEENGGTDNPDVMLSVNWYFINQNNMLNYFETFSEESSPYQHKFRLNYHYNQYNQPDYVKMLITRETIDNRPNPHPNETIVINKFQKNFTFSYKK
ncbi:MAG: hypothetical protein WCP74_05925 [Sphingobacteriia bacterium]|jgi:hypothetical protein